MHVAFPHRGRTDAEKTRLLTELRERAAAAIAHAGAQTADELMDVESFIDTSYVEQALEEIGRYEE